MRDVWDWDAKEFVPMPEEMKAFLEEIRDVCVRHGLSISHEDGHGAFIVQQYSEENIEWLFSAGKDYER